LMAAHQLAAQPLVMAAGDSMNDRSALAVADMAILPSNAHPTLRTWAEKNMPQGSLYIADQPFAAGVAEGYRHFTTAVL
jgi:hydroxymethylpyrimidine pyrophosphatase-like HAD family hydrolase